MNNPPITAIPTILDSIMPLVDAMCAAAQQTPAISAWTEGYIPIDRKPWKVGVGISPSAAHPFGTSNLTVVFKQVPLLLEDRAVRDAFADQLSERVRSSRGRLRDWKVVSLASKSDMVTLNVIVPAQS